MGTIQEPDPDREWLKRSYTDTTPASFSTTSRTEMMGRIVEGSGYTRGKRLFLRTIVWIIIGSWVAAGIAALIQKALSGTP
ncbi:hypothetical protein ACTI_60360 [Actinoplanes sp. OR16]|uniref:hypothetical protein n=1 Tax=Actinoplanes sp. OR16 TaxID=946334 RepID=UPI000F71C912|nr:hypothetical protein [Actinoplanes sp. OR16]BBH69351.1 hypothetical protein ACTI_60360 [Actinoplanes sp. OR16]